MEDVKEKVLEKIKSDLNKQSLKMFDWDGLMRSIAHIDALFSMKL